MPSSATTPAALLTRPTAREASAISVSVPPSPLLSARSRITTYFNVTMMNSAHRMSDNTPSTVARSIAPRSGAEAAMIASRKA